MIFADLQMNDLFTLDDPSKPTRLALVFKKLSERSYLSNNGHTKYPWTLGDIEVFQLRNEYSHDNTQTT